MKFGVGTGTFRITGAPYQSFIRSSKTSILFYLKPIKTTKIVGSLLLIRIINLYVARYVIYRIPHAKLFHEMLANHAHIMYYVDLLVSDITHHWYRIILWQTTESMSG